MAKAIESKDNFILVKYSLQGLNKSERMRFYYSLYGRKKQDKGVVDVLKLVKFSRETLIVPISKIAEVRQYLERWKIGFEELSIMISKEEIKKYEK